MSRRVRASERVFAESGLTCTARESDRDYVTLDIRVRIKGRAAAAQHVEVPGLESRRAGRGSSVIGAVSRHAAPPLRQSSIDRPAQTATERVETAIMYKVVLI